MKVTLKKRHKIWHEAGETVEVSPAEAAFLISVGAAEPETQKEVPETPKRTTRKKET